MLKVSVQIAANLQGSLCAGRRPGDRTRLSRTLDLPLLWLPTTATSGRSTLQSSGSFAYRIVTHCLRIL
jgi:hypothetical protein